MPYTFISATNGAELRFSAKKMRADDDGDTLMFEASYEFVRSPQCTANRRVSGVSGEMRFRPPGSDSKDVSMKRSHYLISLSLIIFNHTGVDIECDLYRIVVADMRRNYYQYLFV